MATAVNLDFFTQTIAVGGITAIWWIQLSTAVISGLAFSTVLTLVMIPVMIALPSTWVRTFWSIVDWFRSLGSVFKRTPAKVAEDADLEGETIEPANEDVEDLPEEEKRPAAKVVSMPKPAPPKIPPQDELPHAAE